MPGPAQLHCRPWDTWSLPAVELVLFCTRATRRPSACLSSSAWSVLLHLPCERIRAPSSNPVLISLLPQSRPAPRAGSALPRAPRCQGPTSASSAPTLVSLPHWWLLQGRTCLGHLFLAPGTISEKTLGNHLPENPWRTSPKPRGPYTPVGAERQTSHSSCRPSSLPPRPAPPLCAPMCHARAGRTGGAAGEAGLEGPGERTACGRAPCTAPLLPSGHREPPRLRPEVSHPAASGVCRPRIYFFSRNSSATSLLSELHSVIRSHPGKLHRRGETPVTELGCF